MMVSFNNEIQKICKYKYSQLHVNQLKLKYFGQPVVTSLIIFRFRQHKIQTDGTGRKNDEKMFVLTTHKFLRRNKKISITTIFMYKIKHSQSYQAYLLSI